MNAVKQMIKDKFNRKGVKLLSIDYSKKNHIATCICPLCGSEFKMYASHFYRGSNGCKCQNVKNKRLHRIYTNMKTRCYNPNSPSYKNYGARGIEICNEWGTYKKFEEWSLKNGYKDDLTIERIDVNGNYSPENCRWATPLEQAQNKRTTILKDGISLKRWCYLHGKSYKAVTSALYKAIKKGKSKQEFVCGLL